MLKMNRGILIALAGTLLLTPDSLFMRWSALDGGVMLAWRATLAGTVFILFGTARLLLANERSVVNIFKLNFWALVVIQISNASFFSFAIAIAPVAVVLIAVATVPIISALLGHLLLKESVSPQFYVTICLVFLGITLSVFGDYNSDPLISLSTLLGALFGLAVALSLALNFTIIRKDRSIPFEVALGTGGLIAGLSSFAIFPEALNLSLPSALYISFTGIFLLPISFFLLSEASRFTSAANVSIIMLLETVLGPLWVWFGVNEKPSHFALIGGVIVVLALVYFLVGEKRSASPIKRN